MKFWNDMRRFLLQLERETSSWCMKKHMPHLDSKDWYIQCAKSLQEASLKELSSIRSSTLMRLVNVLCTSYQEIMPPIPDIVRTEIADVYWEGEEVIFIGYSPFAPLRFHRDIFQFLSRLDGDTPWKEALNKSNQITTEQYTKKEVELLFRRGMLVASAGSHELLPQFSISFDGKQTLNSMMHEGFDVQIHIKAKED